MVATCVTTMVFNWLCPNPNSQDFCFDSLGAMSPSRGQAASSVASITSTASDDNVVDTRDRNVLIAPDGGWGWLVLASTFLCNMIVDGNVYSYGLFMNVIPDDLSMTHGAVSLIGSLLQGFTLFVGPIVSIMSHKFGFRIVTIIGSITAFLGFVASSRSPSIFFLYISYGIVGGIGFGLISIPSSIVIGFYFDKWRALATCVSVCGSSVGAGIIPPLVGHFIANYGWRSAMLFQAVSVLMCSVFALTFRPLKPVTVDQPPSDPPHSPSTINSLTISSESASGSTSGTELPSNVQITSQAASKALIHAAQDRIRTLWTSGSSLREKEMWRWDAEKQLLNRSGTRNDARMKPRDAALLRDSLSLRNYGPNKNPNNDGQGDSDVHPELTGRCQIHNKIKVTRYCITHGLDLTKCDPWNVCRINGGQSVSRNAGQSNSSGRKGERKRQEVIKRKRGGLDDSSSSDEIYEKRKLISDHHKRKERYGGTLTEGDARVDLRSLSLMKLKSRRHPDETVEAGRCWQLLDWSLLRSPSFRLLTASVALRSAVIYVPTVFLPERGRALGMTSLTQALLLSVVSAASTVSRILSGLLVSLVPLVDSVSLTGFSLAFGGIATIVNAYSTTVNQQIVYCVLFGLALGCFNSLLSIIIVDLLGLERLTDAYGLSSLFQGLAMMAGPPIAGWLKGEEEEYQSIFLFSGIVMILSALLMTPLNWLNEREKILASEEACT